MSDLGLSFSGREHSGLDDAANTARLALKFVADGHLLRLTRDVEEKEVDAKKASGHLLRPTRSVERKGDTCTKNVGRGSLSSDEIEKDQRVHSKEDLADSKDGVENKKKASTREEVGAGLGKIEPQPAEKNELGCGKPKLNASPVGENDSGVEIIDLSESSIVGEKDSGFDDEVVVILDELLPVVDAKNSHSKPRNQPLSERASNFVTIDIAAGKVKRKLSGSPLHTSTPSKSSSDRSKSDENSNAMPFVKKNKSGPFLSASYLGTAPLCLCGVRCKLSWVNAPGPNQVMNCEK